MTDPTRRGLRRTGVVAAAALAAGRVAWAKGVDTEIRRAEELLSKGFPKGTVRWEPPKR